MCSSDLIVDFFFLMSLILPRALAFKTLRGDKRAAVVVYLIIAIFGQNGARRVSVVLEKAREKRVIRFKFFVDRGICGCLHCCISFLLFGLHKRKNTATRKNTPILSGKISLKRDYLRLRCCFRSFALSRTPHIKPLLNSSPFFAFAWYESIIALISFWLFLSHFG